MSWADTFGYIAIGNPISQALINTTYSLAGSMGLATKQSKQVATPTPPANLWQLAHNRYGCCFARIAGLSGCMAFVVSAYGASYLDKIEFKQEREDATKLFYQANRYHYFHTIALMVMPLMKRPMLTGSLITLGTMMFCTPMYYRVFTGNKKFMFISTYGSFCLLLAWLTLVF